MRYKVDIFLSMIAILLILQVSAAYALPAEVHLNLCIGLDGHVDISQNDCIGASSHPAQRLDDVLLSADDHHDDCLDLTIGCATADYFRTSTTENSFSKTTKTFRNYSSHPADKNVFYAPRRIPHFLTRTAPPSDITFLRTVVFLI
jgi:hypothetical protein